MSLHKLEMEASKKYYIETIQVENNHMALLTSDNIAKIEAVISLDSNYKNTSDPNMKPVYKENSKNYKNIGSTRYWVEELRKLSESKGVLVTPDGHNYETVIEYLIRAIDKDNSTHLNSDKIGWCAVKERIMSRYGSPSLLINALKNSNNDYSLLNEIANRTRDGEKNHFSFATKFCHYCALFLFDGTDDEDMYSIYDDVIKNALPLYIQYYLGQSVNPKEYTYNYENYIGYIDRVISAAEVKHNTKISRTGFDHLVWYFHKGK